MHMQETVQCVHKISTSTMVHRLSVNCFVKLGSIQAIPTLSLKLFSQQYLLSFVSLCA